MQKIPNYAKMFRSRAVRFVLPLKPGKRSEKNLIKLRSSKATAFFMPNSTDILVRPEKLSDIGCETPRINYETRLGNFFDLWPPIGDSPTRL